MRIPRKMRFIKTIFLIMYSHSRVQIASGLFKTFSDGIPILRCGPLDAKNPSVYLIQTKAKGFDWCDQKSRTGAALQALETIAHSCVC